MAKREKSVWAKKEQKRQMEKYLKEPVTSQRWDFPSNDLLVYTTRLLEMRNFFPVLRTPLVQTIPVDFDDELQCDMVLALIEQDVISPEPETPKVDENSMKAYNLTYEIALTRLVNPSLIITTTV